MDAKYKLGMIYLHMHNEQEGIKWIEDAAAQGQPDAIKLTQLNSNYHQSNAYIDKLNEEKRQKFEQQRRNLQDFTHGILNTGIK